MDVGQPVLRLGDRQCPPHPLLRLGAPQGRRRGHGRLGDRRGRPGLPPAQGHGRPERPRAAAAGACSLVAEAERLLLRDAASEEFGRGPLVHVGNFALNLGLGLLIALGFGHGVVAAISTIVGIVVGEIQVATQPTGAVALLQRYRAGDLTRPSSLPPALTISASRAGERFAVQLSLAF